MNTSNSIVVTNPKVIDFFNRRSDIDPNSCFSLFIDIMEQLSNSMNKTINNNLIEQLLENMKQVNNNVSTLDKKVDQMHQNSINQLKVELTQFKKDYISDLQLNLTSNVSNKIEPLFKSQTETFFDKFTRVIHETMPNNSLIKDEINSGITSLTKTIFNDLQKLQGQNVTASSLEKFVQSIDLKITQAINNNGSAIMSGLTATEERIDKKISDVKSTTDIHINSSQSINSSLTSLLQRMENSSAKGKVGENMLVDILVELYPSAEVKAVANTKETGDVILSRKDKTSILFENKYWKDPPNQAEVKKFIRDTEIQKCSGIFLSQKCGIANKDNFEINVHNGEVLMYIHNVNYDPLKIKIAVDVIDQFKCKLQNLDDTTEVDTIPKDILDKINQELQYLVSTKLALVSMAKDFNQKFISKLDEIKLVHLENYLTTRYANSTSKFTCEYCDIILKNKAALSAHKRFCKAKPGQENMTVTISTS